MKTLLAPTEDYIKLERTELAADASAGSNVTLTLKNNNGIAQNTYIVIGKEGSEKAELEQVNAAVSGNTDVQVATLKFAHKKGEPVTVYRYNQRKFYGALTKTGTYNELTTDGSPKDIQVDDPQGTILEYTQADGYLFFKATYYNSTTTDETSTSDADPVEADESKRYASIYSIRKMAGFTENPFISDGRIESKRQQAENEINSHIFTRYQLPMSEVPKLISYVCECLAAGYLHYEEFGPEGDAVKKLGEGRGILKQIMDGKQRLLDSDFAELALVTGTNVLRGLPDGTEDTDDISGNERKFKMSDEY